MRRDTRRGWLVAAAALGAALLGGSALAWACTADAAIQLNPQSGPVGTDVQVTGDAFTDNPVELRWDDGRLLGTAQGPSFVATVTIPEASLGEHTIIATNVGASLGLAPQAFLVTAKPQEPTDQGPKKGSGGNSKPDGNANPGGNSGSSPPGRADSKAPGDTRVERAGSPPGAGDSGSLVQREVSLLGRTMFAGSAPAADARRGASRGAEAISERSAVSDPAAGYSAGTAPSLGSGSVVPGSDGSDTPFAFGLALLGTGMLVLLGGGLFLVLAKRKATADRDPRSTR